MCACSLHQQIRKVDVFASMDTGAAAPVIEVAPQAMHLPAIARSLKQVLMRLG
jgi:hypothetical protein